MNSQDDSNDFQPADELEPPLNHTVAFITMIIYYTMWFTGSRRTRQVEYSWIHDHKGLTFIRTDSLSFSLLTIFMATFWFVTQWTPSFTRPETQKSLNG